MASTDCKYCTPTSAISGFVFLRSELNQLKSSAGSRREMVMDEFEEGDDDELPPLPPTPFAARIRVMRIFADLS